MKVKMLVSMAGAAVSYQPGQVVEVSDEAGRAWIASGTAAAVEEPKQAKKKPFSKRAE